MNQEPKEPEQARQWVLMGPTEPSEELLDDDGPYTERKGNTQEHPRKIVECMNKGTKKINRVTRYGLEGVTQSMYLHPSLRRTTRKLKNTPLEYSPQQRSRH